MTPEHSTVYLIISRKQSRCRFFEVKTILIKFDRRLCPIFLSVDFETFAQHGLDTARRCPGSRYSTPGISLVGRNRSSFPRTNGAAFSCHLQCGTRSPNRGRHRGFGGPERWEGWSGAVDPPTRAGSLFATFFMPIDNCMNFSALESR